MKRSILPFFLAAMLAACCSDNSSSSDNDNDPSTDPESSEESTGTSSSRANGDKNASSGSSSSSSVAAGETEHSSSSGVYIADDWEVPKEDCPNPDIDYGTMTDPRDKKVYRTITIVMGDFAQTWMAENLNYYDESDPSIKDKSWCYGKADNKDSTTCDVIGRYYTWAAAIDSAGIYSKSRDCGYEKECDMPGLVEGVCPPGWHLPDDLEWEALFSAVKTLQLPNNGDLRSRCGWLRDDNGTDDIGFAAMPAGSGDNQGYAGGSIAFFWSSTQVDEVRASSIHIFDNKPRILHNSKTSGLNVRCIEDLK